MGRNLLSVTGRSLFLRHSQGHVMIKTVLLRRGGNFQNMKKKITIKDIIFLQVVIMIYTGSSIAAKFAAAQSFFSIRFFMFYGIEIIILGVYAVLWQQIIKRFALSTAYANRAMVLVWSMLWAAVIFHNEITVQNVAGMALVVAGTVIVNLDTREEKA